VTREEAEKLCQRLASDSHERETHHWVPHRQRNGEWSVAKIGLPPTKSSGGTPETRADEKPATPDDPRPAQWRDVPPFGAGPG
jgi:hypothetical protein